MDFVNDVRLFGEKMYTFAIEIKMECWFCPLWILLKRGDHPEYWFYLDRAPHVSTYTKIEAPYFDLAQSEFEQLKCP